MTRYFRLALASLLLLLPTVPAAVGAAAQDCDANAIIWCGATTKSELLGKLHNGDGHHSAASLQSIMHNRGVTLADIGSSNTVLGTVGKNGNVTVNGAVVATEAESLGRQNIPGSKANGSLWQRPTSVSFQSDSISAFVFMPNGKFKWAILTSCGNITYATAVPTAPVPVHPAAVVHPTPPATPVPTPTPVTVNQVQIQTQSVVAEAPEEVEHQVVAATPNPVTPPVKPVRQLPQSGPELAFIPLAALAGAATWYHHSRRQLGLALRKTD